MLTKILSPEIHTVDSLKDLDDCYKTVVGHVIIDLSEDEVYVVLTKHRKGYGVLVNIPMSFIADFIEKRADGQQPPREL